MSSILSKHPNMIIPVRCFTCGEIVGDKWIPFCELRQHYSAKESMDRLDISKYCCRRMIMGHVDVVDNLMQYAEENNLKHHPFIKDKETSIPARVYKVQ